MNRRKTIEEIRHKSYQAWYNVVTPDGFPTALDVGEDIGSIIWSADDLTWTTLDTNEPLGGSRELPPFGEHLLVSGANLTLTRIEL